MNLKNEYKMTDIHNNKKLFINILLFALSSFVPKVLSFLLMPIYTSYLTTEDYGTSDLIITTASLLLPIFTLAISNAVIRFTIENKNDRRPYLIAIRIYIAGCFTLAPVLGVVGFIFKINLLYLAFIFILFAVSAMYQIKVAYLRGMERVSFLTVCTIVHSFISLLANVVFITIFKWGLYGFVLASILGYLTADVMIAIQIHKDRIYKMAFSLKKEKTYAKQMLSYSIPLIFSGLMWWVNSVSDRYFVTWLISSGANGIYSVSYKIPTILQLVQDVFTPAWNLSVFDVYNKKDGMDYINKIYDFYNFVIVFACSGLIFLDKPLAKFLFSNEFYNAWQYVPVLLISVVFISMGACVGPILSAYKKSKLTARGSLYSGAANIVLNFILISWIGIQGAAIATAISYFVSWLYNVFQARKLCSFKINWTKHGIMYLLLVIECIMVLYLSEFWMSGIVIIFIVILNISNLIKLYTKSRDMAFNVINRIKAR